MEQENVDILEVLFDLVDRCSFLFRNPNDLKGQDKKQKNYVRNGTFAEEVNEQK
jgi:hypothetical protein